MPTFAELRARAEAAASNARDNANSKLVDYRGDKKFRSPSYKVPPLRSPVKPPVPSGLTCSKLQESAPPVQQNQHMGYCMVEDLAEESSKRSAPNSRASMVRTINSEEHTSGDGGIDVLLKNKDLFFRFMDEFFASKGFPVRPRSLPEDSDIKVEFDDESDEQSYPGSEGSREHLDEGIDTILAKSEDVSQEKQLDLSVRSVSAPPVEPSKPTTLAEREPAESTVSEVVSPPPLGPPEMPSSPFPLISCEKPPSPPPLASHEMPSSLPPLSPLPTSQGISRAPTRRVPPVPKKPNYLRSPPSPEPTIPSFEETPRAYNPPNIPPPLSHTLLIQDGEDERGLTPSSLMNVNARLSSITKSPSSVMSRRTPSTSTSSSITVPPVVSAPTRPVVIRATRPIQDLIHSRKFAPPPPFFTGELDENWTPSQPYGYMPQAGRRLTEGQCSAAQLCSYFAENVPWDFWYTADDTAARPAHIINRIEARWKGSMFTSQETKRRLFGSDKVSTEKSRMGVITFQDLSIAWYRVAWKESTCCIRILPAHPSQDEDPVKSLKREARYRAAPSPFNGENLYAAHLLYGQAITDFCERAIRMRQFIGGGEAWDLASGALKEMAKYKPHAPPVVPTIGHSHGHLIYEGMVTKDHQRMWGSTRGGESAIRNGDIIEWCDAEFQLQDEQGETTILSVGEEGYTSVILSSAEFPERLEEDSQTLPPIRLPELEIATQSVSNGMLPTKRVIWFDTMTKGRIWIYRCVGWEYLGLHREPEADWPPPVPTLFLPP